MTPRKISAEPLNPPTRTTEDRDMNATTITRPDHITESAWNRALRIDQLLALGRTHTGRTCRMCGARVAGSRFAPNVARGMCRTCHGDALADYATPVVVTVPHVDPRPARAPRADAVTPDTHTCPGCRADLPITSYPTRRNRATGTYDRDTRACRPCVRAGRR